MNDKVSVAVVGGGIGGIAAVTMLKRAGYHNVTVFERSAGLGGVWYANIYPGAACDVPSHFYEYSFALNPDWSRRYAPQAEIKAYLERVVRDHGVEGSFRFNTQRSGHRRRALRPWCRAPTDRVRSRSPTGRWC